jgi:hypothetical protein
VNRVAEVEGERGVLLSDARDRLADAARHGLARPVAHVGCLARPPAQAVGPRELVAQKLDLTADLLRPARVGLLGRLGQLGLEVVEPLAVRGARRGVESLARVAEIGGDRDRVATARGPGLAAGGEVGTVELLTRALVMLVYRARRGAR